jgi:hypothetical protein
MSLKLGISSVRKRKALDAASEQHQNHAHTFDDLAEDAAGKRPSIISEGI